MNLLDFVVLILLALFLLAGYYRGFLATLFSVGGYLVSAVLSFLFMPVIANTVKGSEALYGMMLNYTEGAEYIGNVELSRTAISGISHDQLTTIVSNPDLPYPMGARIGENVAKEAFAAQGVSTLGEYFNLTIVNVFINILSFLVLFIALYAVISFILHMLDYARSGFRVLQVADGFIGAGVGVIRGFLILFVLFLIVPIILTLIPIDAIETLIDGSFFGRFFCESNFLLYFIPGT